MNAAFAEWLLCLKTYARMCVFIASPANLPASLGCIALSLIAYLITDILWLQEEHGMSALLAQVSIELGILYAISFIILKFRNKIERLSQTMSALIGVNLVISLVSLPILSVLPDAPAEGQINALTLQVNRLILFWNLAVISLIFKRAFDISIIAAGFVTFNFFVLYILILTSLFK